MYNLYGRKCRILKGSQRSSNYIFRKALKAADNILIQLRFPSNPKALTVKGEALYNMGDFEHALVCFHKAMRTASTKVILDVLPRTVKCSLCYIFIVVIVTISFFRRAINFISYRRRQLLKNK